MKGYDNRMDPMHQPNGCSRELTVTRPTGTNILATSMSCAAGTIRLFTRRLGTRQDVMSKLLESSLAILCEV